MEEPLGEEKKDNSVVSDLLPSRNEHLQLKKKIGIRAYFSWLILGFMGLHRFYVDKSWSGLIMLLAFMLGVLLYSLFIGKIIILAVIIWWLSDAFRLPAMIRLENKR